MQLKLPPPCWSRDPTLLRFGGQFMPDLGEGTGFKMNVAVTVRLIALAGVVWHCASATSCNDSATLGRQVFLLAVSAVWLFQTTKHGPKSYPAGYETDMPSFAERMTHTEIAAVLAYIKSTWPADIRTRQARPDVNSRQR